MKTSIKIEKEMTFLCSWNHCEVVEIHTESTLNEEYKDTSLFDQEDRSWFFEGEITGFDAVLQCLKGNDEYLNQQFNCHNMMIQRIK